MSASDEIWAWIYPPLQELKAEHANSPGQSWEELRAFFLEHAGLRDSSENPLVEDLIRQLDELQDDERERLLSSDEIDRLGYDLAQQHGTEASEDTVDDSAYDEGEWQAYLIQNGDQWDGAEDSWQQFREWFLYYARERGVLYPATGLLTYLDGQQADDRVATLAQYGVVISPYEQSPDSAPVGDLAADIIQEVLAEHPEFAAIPEERRRELLAELLEEQSSGAWT